MSILLTLCMLSGTFQQRQDTIHAMKISSASFEQLAAVYRGIDQQQWPEMSANLREVLESKWYSEKLTFYFPLDEYYYPSDKERLSEAMWKDFERELKND